VFGVGGSSVRKSLGLQDQKTLEISYTQKTAVWNWQISEIKSGDFLGVIYIESQGDFSSAFKRQFSFINIRVTTPWKIFPAGSPTAITHEKKI